MECLNFNSVELLPNAKASAAFSADSGSVFREQDDIAPLVIDDRLSYMPWGADNQMPYEILNLIESDETLTTCQIFNAEVCYGSGPMAQGVRIQVHRIPLRHRTSPQRNMHL